MNAFESTNPYPEFYMKGIKLPSGKVYSYDPQNTKMFNSGIIGIDKGHKLVLEDAIALIDAMQKMGYNAILQSKPQSQKLSGYTTLLYLNYVKK